MSEVSTWAGLDVHKDQITVALISRDSQQVENFEIRNEPKGIRRLTRRLGRVGKESVQIAYEAGPCGYALQRQLQGLGFSYLGLVPSEHSSGARQSRGGITKAGNSSIRRLLIEAAWHDRHRPGVGVKLRQRRREQPAKMIALADRAQQRLHRRYSRLVLGRGKQPQKAAAESSRGGGSRAGGICVGGLVPVSASGRSGSGDKRTLNPEPKEFSLDLGSAAGAVPRWKDPRGSYATPSLLGDSRL